MSPTKFAKYFIGLILTLPIGFSLGAHGEGKKSVKQKNAPAFFLTYKQTFQLNLEDRLAYFESALDYIVLYERIQTKAFASNNEYAWLNNINSFLDLLPEANAVGGRTCLCGTYAGSFYSKEKGCDTPSVSTACGAGKFTCNPSLFNLKGNPTCVTAGGTCAGRSQSCVTEFRSQRSKLGMSPQELNSWAKEASHGLSNLKIKSFGPSRVEEHCAKNKGDKDCLALAEVERDITAHGAQVATAEQRQEIQADAYEGKKAAIGQADDNFTPKGLPGANPPDKFPPAPTSRPSEPINPGAGCANQLSVNLGALSCVACGLAAADGEAASQGVSEYVALMGVVAQTYDGGPHKTNTESGRQKLLSNVIDRISAYGFCTDSEYGSGALSNSNSQRVIRGIIDGQSPTRKSFLFFKWGSTDQADTAFSSLGIGPQQRKSFNYSQLFNYKDAGADPSPIEAIDNPTKGNERAPASTNNVRKTPGTDPLTRFFNRLFGNKPTAPRAPTRAYSNELFNDRPQAPVTQKNWDYRSNSQGHLNAFPNSAFSSCTQGLQRRGGTKATFNICEPDKKGFTLNHQNYQKNEALRNSLYQSCGLAAPKRKEPRFCPNKCVSNYAFGANASWLRHCDGDSGSPSSDSGKGAEAESSRGDDPGKGAEAESSHGDASGAEGGKGAEGSSTR